MIGIVVVGYGALPEAMLIALQYIMGEQSQIVAVPLEPEESPAEQRKAVLKAIEYVEDGSGVLMFTDSAESTAGYLMLSILQKTDIHVVNGVNLPMLCQISKNRHKSTVEELAGFARDEGRKGIILRKP